MKETRTSIVFCFLSKLSVSKATDLDKISAKLLRVCPDLIADCLCSIFNHSINTGIFLTNGNFLVQPYFDYCCVVWDNCSKTLADKLQKLQNRAARILNFSSYDVDVDVVLASIDWKKFETQRKIQKAVMVHKSLHGLAPDYLRSMFVNRSIVANYSLRDTEGKLAIPKPCTDYLRNSFSFSGAVLWNSLPHDLRQTENPNHFKAGCINFLPMNCMLYTALLESRSIIVN